MKLLIVEDDENTASYIKYVMECEKHDVRTASAVGAARFQMKDFTPDLVILDRSLPDQDGVAFCRELKRDPRLGRVPVLFVSARGSAAEIAEGLDAGCADYVTKPFDLVELINRVDGLLHRFAGPHAAA